MTYLLSSLDALAQEVRHFKRICEVSPIKEPSLTYRILNELAFILRKRIENASLIRSVESEFSRAEIKDLLKNIAVNALRKSWPKVHPLILEFLAGTFNSYSVSSVSSKETLQVDPKEFPLLYGIVTSQDILKIKEEHLKAAKEEVLRTFLGKES